MQLFTLTPNYSIWPKTTYKPDILIIRATSKQDAMRLVKLATFTMQPKVSIGKRMPNPWLNRSYATLAAYSGTDFSTDGKAEILAPSWLREYFLTLK